jgi:aerobic carbon-monoxide dehydrogenase medium subunit
MIPAEFEYERATSLDHAIELLSRDEAKVLAGGHSLIPAMRLRLARPELLVDIGGLDDLRYVREADGGLAIGALTRHSELLANPLVRERCAVLVEATSLVADPQVRHRGTIGGSLAHGDPASDQATVLAALEATFVARGPDGERTIPAAEFFKGWFETALGPQDVLTEIRVPGGSSGVYEKFSRRSHDWATVGVAAVRVDGSTRLALTSMGPTPIRARAVEEALAGGASPEDAAQRADEGASPASDPSGSADYRRQLARVLTRRALERLG